MASILRSIEATRRANTPDTCIPLAHIQGVCPGPRRLSRPSNCPSSRNVTCRDAGLPSSRDLKPARLQVVAQPPHTPRRLLRQPREGRPEHVLRAPPPPATVSNPTARARRRRSAARRLRAPRVGAGRRSARIETFRAVLGGPGKRTAAGAGDDKRRRCRDGVPAAGRSLRRGQPWPRGPGAALRRSPPGTADAPPAPHTRPVTMQHMGNISINGFDPKRTLLIQSRILIAQLPLACMCASKVPPGQTFATSQRPVELKVPPLPHKNSL